MNQNRREALQEGKPHYLGEPCKHGHGGTRYVANGGCVTCVILSAHRSRSARLARRKGQGCTP